MMITPYLDTPDVEGTIKFFIETLGFELSFSMPGQDGKTSFAIVRRGESTSFMLGSLSNNEVTGKAGEGINFWVYLEEPNFDLDGFYTSVKNAGGKIVDELQDGYWGDRFFGVNDPNGYRLTFAKTVEEVPNDEVLERAAKSST